MKSTRINRNGYNLLGEPTEQDVQAAQGLLWEVLARQPLRLRVTEVDEAELRDYPLRRGTKVRGRVRLVMFEREPEAQCQTVSQVALSPFDVTACGGLHVPWAAQVLPVVILRSERTKGVTRITFMAGEEAAQYLSGVYGQARRLAQEFSTGVGDLPERVQTLREQLSQERQHNEALRQELAALRVQALPPEPLGAMTARFLWLAEDEISWWTQALKAVPAGEVLVVVSAAGRCAVASACAAVSAVEVLRSALERSGGKGGGKADMAQGQYQDVQAFVAAVREYISEEW